MVNLTGWEARDDRIEVLRKWLSEKPFEWGPALATRAAFRSVPWLLNSPSQRWLGQFSLLTMHSLFVAWSTTSRPVKGHKHAADLSVNLLHHAAMHHDPDAFFASGMRHLDNAIIAKMKIDKADHSLRAIVAFDKLIRAKPDAVPISDDFFWGNLQRDVDFLSPLKNNNGAKSLLRREFVVGDEMGVWGKYSLSGLSNLVEIDPSFSFWKTWFEAIVKSRDLNFFKDDPSADASVKDRQVSASIIHEIDVEFWSREPSEVVADIQNWIESEADGLAVDDSRVASLPAQNANAISFQANDEGLIELSDLRHSNQPSDDGDTIDRYEECIDIARELHHQCEKSNSARRLSHLLDRYLSAAGEKLSELRPSLFVQRGERLRQEIAAYKSDDTMLAPIADDLLLDLRAWEASHNMLVGLDPALMTRDTALAGPPDRIANVPPKDIRDLALDADDSGLLANNVGDIIVEAAELAPEIPDPQNRRTIWSFETGRNLIIEAFNIAMRHPGKAAIGGVVTASAVATVGPAGMVVSAAAGAIPAAHFLLRHKTWIETRLGDSPTWRGLFSSLTVWMDENLPPPKEGEKLDD